MNQNYLLNSLYNFYTQSDLPAFITYGDVNLGEAIADKISLLYKKKTGKIEEFVCCEIGTGRGLVAKGLVDRLKDKHPHFYKRLSLILVDLSRKCLKDTERNLSQHKEKVELICADANNLPLKSESIDFQYSNELLDALPFKLYQRKKMFGI
jgi:SAM-dependent MidA family methyltransferase